MWCVASCGYRPSPLARDMWCKNRTCVDLQQDSPGGGGGCGCGSVEEGELCELTCGTAAEEGGGSSMVKHRGYT